MAQKLLASLLRDIQLAMATATARATPRRLGRAMGEAYEAAKNLKPRAKEGDYPASASTRKPPQDPQLQVLRYDPGRYVIVIKPADVRMDGAFDHTVQSLVYQYLRTSVTTPHVPEATEQHPQKPMLRFVHRLDYATSGVLLVALDRIPAAVAGNQFETRKVGKHYLALVHGLLEKRVVFEDRVADCPHGSFRMVIGNSENPGRASRTECFPLATGMYHGVPISKVRLVPFTGRRHQLRIHCAHAGFPIVGDATYGPPLLDNGFLPPRMMLHAKSLRIRLPVGQIHGRKSALRAAEEFTFDAGDCFENLDGLVLDKPKPAVIV